MNMNDWTNMIEQTREAIARYRRAGDALRGVMLGQGYVVVCQGLPLAFDIEDGVVKNPRPSEPQKATRFTLEDAAQVAKEVKNGNGTPGEVMHVRHAIVDAILEQQALLTTLEEHTPKAPQ